jgi:ABC-type transport system substrate-binding protein
MKAVLRILPLVALIAVLGVAVFPAAGQELLTVSAECGAENNTSNFAAIEAIDAMTVKFTLCNPDPAFLSKSHSHPSSFSRQTIWNRRVAVVI